MRASRLRTTAKRLAQIALGLLLGLIVAEALLQVAALATRSYRGGHIEGPIGDGRRIAFLGDSNTYGLMAGFNNSFPQVLQRRWQPPGQAAAVEVLNLGTPGLNSSKLRQQLPGILVELQPKMLVIMIGVNDLWTAPVSVDGQEVSWHYRLWRWSRVYRMLYMISKIPESRRSTIARDRSLTNPTIRVADDVRLVWTGRMESGNDVRQWNVRLQENLKSMIADARQVGIDTVLVTYPADSGFYEPVNELIRETGALTHTPVVDVAAAFHEVCPDGKCPDLLLPDEHPTPKGHQMVADLLWKYFTGVGAAQFVPATPAGAPAADTPGQDSRP